MKYKYLYLYHINISLNHVTHKTINEACFNESKQNAIKCNVLFKSS